MNDDNERKKKIITTSLLFGTQLFSFMIRFAFGVVAPTLMRQYNLSPKTMGYILSAWNWSYTAGLPFIGIVVDRFGPYIVLGLGSVLWAVFTIALPISTVAASLFLMRVIFGFAQTPLIPAGAAAISRGFGIRERGRVIATAFAGNQVGLAVAATTAALILAKWGWQAVFYCLGAASLLLSLAWFAFYPDRRIGTAPPTHLDSARSGTMEPSSWLSLFRFRGTWGIAFGQMGYLYAYFFFVSWLPGYLILERKMTLLQSGIAAALPFWVGLFGTLGGGWLADYLIERGMSTTVSRKSIIGGGLLVSTVLMVAGAYVERGWLSVTLLSLCIGFLRLATGSVSSLPIDLAPRLMVASLTSIQNFFGNIGGLMAPIITGYVVNATGSFALAFVAAGGMALFGAASYVLIVGEIGPTRRPAQRAGSAPLLVPEPSSNRRLD